MEDLRGITRKSARWTNHFYRMKPSDPFWQLYKSKQEGGNEFMAGDTQNLLGSKNSRLTEFRQASS